MLSVYGSFNPFFVDESFPWDVVFSSYSFLVVGTAVVSAVLSDRIPSSLDLQLSDQNIDACHGAVMGWICVCWVRFILYVVN